MMIESEIVIIGAGPAGATAALALAEKGIPSTIVEKAIFPRDKICGDALSGKVLLTLKKINPALAEELSDQSFCLPSHGITFFAPNGKSLRVPFHLEKKEIAPGFVAARLDFDNWLFKKTSENNLITTHCGVEINKWSKSDNEWILQDNKQDFNIKCKLVIAADGAHSSFAKREGGIRMDPEHYSAGLRAYYEGVNNLDSEGYIELHFLKGILPGYLWIFPMTNNRANVGIGMRSDIVSSKKINLKKVLEEYIQHDANLSKRFKDAKPVGKINGYGLPLGSIKRKVSGNGFILLGDAASVIDPFSGEGIGNAMICGLKAADIIAPLYSVKKYDAVALSAYDEAMYKRLWPELRLSYKMQKLSEKPWLFNLIVNKAQRSKTLRETITCMFEDLDMRARLGDPSFYFKILTGK